MKYYSTNGLSERVSLKDAVIKGLASDKGLFMPERIPTIPAAFFKNIGGLSLLEISFTVAESLFGEDIASGILKEIVYDALNFDIPLIHIADNRYSLELYHGPTLAFKDVGARFMARILGYFNSMDNDERPVNVLVATSGDTGSAVANGFLNVEGVRVYVLYPKGKVSQIQESQFTTLGRNITALEVDGTFDDCQALVKNAFLDEAVNSRLKLTSANSINIARFLPQMFYYFYAYAQLMKQGGNPSELVFAVPSGNFGNLTAGLVAKRMGLPVKRFIAANNRNDVFYQYLQSGDFRPRPSVQTIANAMDVGNPSNFARILDLYGNSHHAIVEDISGAVYDDNQIKGILKETYSQEGYLLDPHGAIGYGALKAGLEENEIGVCLETAHPAKFKDVVESVIGKEIAIPERLRKFMEGTKRTVPMSAEYDAFRDFLMER